MERVVFKRNPSLLDEIRAKDIYTVLTPESCPSLPDTLARSINASHQPSSESPLFDEISNSVSFYVSYSSADEDETSSKMKVKRLSIGRYQNLPAVLEEDLNIGAISRDQNDVSSESSEDVFIQGIIGDGDGNPADDEESWVDLSRQTRTPPPQSSSEMNQPTSPDRVAPSPFGNGEEYLRLLREAQKESNQSSTRVSSSSSRKDSPRDSPKSPPNSPNTETALEPEEAHLQGVYINYYNREGDFVRVEKNVESDWIWDWSSRPDQTPPKEWHFVHPAGKVATAGRGASIRKLMVGNSNIFSRDVLYTLLLTNVISLLLGTGIGIWISKRSGGASASASPLN